MLLLRWHSILHITGSESAFANLMNQEAKKIGMANTHFVNATGLSTVGHQASVHNLAKRSQLIIKTSNQYYAIYGQKAFTYNGIKQSNRNSLLFLDPTIYDLKIGHTNEQGIV